uniref:Ig-like domain-containing protein n=1 Tax=Paramormyrops kingsleyae TaxID=1676925 RepID=A0A3B3S6Y6_9TELE
MWIHICGDVPGDVDEQAHELNFHTSLLLSLLVNQLGNFHTVPTGVSTVKEVSVQEGGSVTIPCFYEDRYKTHVKYWCRGYFGDSCPPIVHSDSPQEGKVSVRDDPDQRVFTVTINNLTVWDSGYYSCGVKICGASDVEDQVHLSVTGGKMSVLYTVANEMHMDLYLCCFSAWTAFVLLQHYLLAVVYRLCLELQAC